MIGVVLDVFGVFDGARSPECVLPNVGEDNQGNEIGTEALDCPGLG